MKIDVIDCRGFVKTPPLINNTHKGASHQCRKIGELNLPFYIKVSGQVNGKKVVASPLKPSIK